MMDRDSGRPNGVVAVVGAGLAGSMMALMLAKRGFEVELYEKRPDFRVLERSDAKDGSHLGQSADALRRSINLALSFRGQEALRAVGLLDEIMAHIVPMPARGIHDVNGVVTLQPYGKPGQFICSASRSLLNRSLLDACDRLPNVRCYFETAIVLLDQDNRLTVRDERTRVERTVQPQLVIGSDGAYSVVRTAMLRYSRMDFSREYISHAYKELTIPAIRGPSGTPEFALPSPHALHIWPRHDFMMIALPNPDMCVDAVTSCARYKSCRPLWCEVHLGYYGQLLSSTSQQIPNLNKCRTTPHPGHSRALFFSHGLNLND